MKNRKITSLKDALEVLVSVRGFAEDRYKMKLLGVFGSWVRGEEKKTSDIDILVKLDSGRSLLDIVAIKQDLEDLLG